MHIKLSINRFGRSVVNATPNQHIYIRVLMRKILHSVKKRIFPPKKKVEDAREQPKVPKLQLDRCSLIRGDSLYVDLLAGKEAFPRAPGTQMHFFYI